MKEKKSLALTFIVLFSIAILSVVFIIINIHQILTVKIFQIIFLITLISIITGFFFLRRLINEIKYDIDEKKGKEKNIRDCYQYFQLLDPPNDDN